jgi:hypothetical protein
MSRSFVGALAVALVAFGFAVADEFQATITKVEDGKVTYKKFKGFNKEEMKVEYDDEKTLPTTKDVKVVKAKFDFKEKKSEAGEAIEDGLKNAMFKDIGKEKKGKFGGGGLFATIITDSGNKNITEIRVVTFDFKKKKKDDK